jgi:tripartite ATP-independent transporter DctP family solute receptor
LLTAAVALASAFLWNGSARAELKDPITARLGHVMQTTHFEHIAFVQLAEDVARRSNGKIKIELFPASQLGSEREQTEQVNLGALEMHSSGGAIQNYAPQLGAWSLPFLFRSPEHYDHVMDGPVGKQFVDLLLKKSNIRILAFYPNGERMFFNNKKPLTTLADFKGVKIRVDDQPISAQIWRTLGANPVPIAFSEVYNALQSGVVDAGENPPTNIIRMRFYEVGKYVTVTRHSLTTMCLMVNEGWWQKLPGEARDIIQAAVKDWTPSRRKVGWSADIEAVGELKQLGASISEVANPKEFSDALLPLYDEFGNKTGSTEIIKEIRATN